MAYPDGTYMGDGFGDIKENKLWYKEHLVFNEAGDILKVGELNPSNQLRGYFFIETKNGRIGIAFTLTPERDPKVQKLQVVFQKT